MAIHYKFREYVAGGWLFHTRLCFKLLQVTKADSVTPLWKPTEAKGKDWHKPDSYS